MVQNLDYKFPMPYSSWDAIRKILRAYNAASDRENPTVTEIADLAGIHRPQVSANNKFLREVGLLQTDKNKLSQIGSRVANGFELGNESMILEALQESVNGSPGLSKFVNTLRARGTMSVEAFKAQVITAAGLTADSPTLVYVRTVIDYLETAQMIRIEGNNIIFTGHGLSGFAPEEKPPTPPTSTPPVPPKPAQNSEELGIPIPLGLAKLAYLKLPEGWTNKDLPKLLKLIELSLGDDSE
jgi:hypothetical protein